MMTKEVGVVSIHMVEEMMTICIIKILSTVSYIIVHMMSSFYLVILQKYKDRVSVPFFCTYK